MEKSKGLKLTISIILGMILLISIGMNVHAAFFVKKEKCDNKVVEKCINKPVNEDEKKEYDYNSNTPKEHDYPKVRVVNEYTREETREDISFKYNLLLLEDGTYYEKISGPAESSNRGTYSISNNTLKLYGYFHTGSGSGLDMNESPKVSTYSIKNDGLYANNKLVYTNVNSNNDKLDTVFDYLYDILLQEDNSCVSKSTDGIYLDMFCEW